MTKKRPVVSTTEPRWVIVLSIVSRSAKDLALAAAALAAASYPWAH